MYLVLRVFSIFPSKQHGTCPVCRKTLLSETSNNSREGSGGGSGGIHFHFGRGGDTR